MLSGCDPTVDIALVLDSSASVTEANFQLMLDFAKQIIYHADVDSGHQRLAAVTFNSDVKVSFHLKDHASRAAAYWAMDRVRYRSGGSSSSNTARALQTLRQDVFNAANGDRPEASNVAVVLIANRGRSSSVHRGGRTVTEEAELLRAAGTHVYVIGIGVRVRDRDRSQLAALATSPAERNVFSPRTFADLSRSLREKLSFCNEQRTVTGIRFTAVVECQSSSTAWAPRRPGYGLFLLEKLTPQPLPLTCQRLCNL